MIAPLSPKQLAEIRAMKFVTGLNAACGHFDTPVERELYDLAAVNYNARLQLLAEVERLTARATELETERHSTNESLNDATVSDRDELKRLRDHITELEAKIERRRLRLIAAEDDLLQVRGTLSPNGFPRKVPMELGASVVPAVEWLVDRVAELEAAAEAEVTVYRAAYEDGIPLGLYTTEAAAKAHCDDLLRRENTGRTWDWATGQDGDLVQFFVSQLADRPEETTGYIVTEVTVAAEYDAEADE